MPIAYLAHPYTGEGLADAWRQPARNAARVEAIARGIEATMPRFRPRFPHGRAPAYMVLAEAAGDRGPVLRWCLRLLLGDGLHEEGMGPRWSPPGGRAEACDQLWLVGPVSKGVELEVRAACAAGLPVVELDAGEQDALIRSGFAAVARAEREATERVVDRVLRGVLGEREFRGARAVVAAFFLSETWTLGGGGSHPGRPGRGVAGTTAFRAHVERRALRMLQARRLVIEAGLTAEERVALRLREVEDRTWRQVSLGLGWPDDGAGDRRAERLVARALGRVARAIRRSEGAEA
mgnify:FL=1